MSDRGADKMKRFAAAKTNELLDAVVFAMHDAVRLHEAAAIHRMRVSIRRLQQALRLFRQFLSQPGVKSVNKDLRKAMKAAGALRNFDIAAELLKPLGAIPAGLDEQRSAALAHFRQTVKSIIRKDAGVRWRNELGLSS